MLIISKFRDYYDSVGHTTGVDKTIVYKRDTTALNESNFRSKLNIESYRIGTRLGLHAGTYGYIEDILFVIGFCGKTYVCLRRLDSTPGSSSCVYYYGNSMLPILFDNHSKQKSKDNAYQVLTDFLHDYHDKEHSEIFIKHKVPVFFEFIGGQHWNNLREKFNAPDGLDHSPLILNPPLDSLLFYTQIDSFQAFQKIQNYISGVIGINQNPVVEISDKHKIAAHGFDTKMGFRKRTPPKRKIKTT